MKVILFKKGSTIEMSLSSTKRKRIKSKIETMSAANASSLTLQRSFTITLVSEVTNLSIAIQSSNMKSEPRADNPKLNGLQVTYCEKY